MAGYAVHPGRTRSRLTIRLQWVTTLIAVTAFLIADPGLLVGIGAVTQYGFSGTPRTMVTDCARHIRAHTRPDDLIISDPFIALVSERIKVVRFKDNWGLIIWMNRMIDKGAYRDAVKALSKRSFGDVRAWSQQFWMPLVQTAFASGKVGAVVPNYELPLPGSMLEKCGLRKTFKNRFYIVWTRPPDSQSGR